MIDGLRPYSETKPSGLPWLGDMPAHWDVRRNGRLFGSRRETGFPDLPVLEVSLRSGVRVRDFENGTRKQEMGDRSKYQRAVRGDIAYNMMRMWQGAVGVAPVDGLVSPAYVVARPFEETDAAYYAYLFRTSAYMREVDIFSRGIVPDRNRLYWESFKQMPSVYPPFEEQRLIARFLDWHGAQTAKLIRAKKKIIALLNEQKQAIIHHAVTRGLDPNVRVKPSGIPWVGDVPEGWEVKRIKQISRILRGKFTHRPRNDPAFYGGPYPFIQTGGVARASMYISDFLQTLNEKGLAVSKLFPKGTLCMTIAANIGDVAILDFDACFPDSVVGFAPKNGSDINYLYSVFKCMKPELMAEAPVNTQGNLNVERIGAMYIPVPCIEEQQAITREIAVQSKAWDQLIERTKSEIALVQEFRVRLISDVVTGKLDVRAAAASLSEILEAELIEELIEDDDLDEAVDDAENQEVAA